MDIGCRFCHERIAFCRGLCTIHYMQRHRPEVAAVMLPAKSQRGPALSIKTSAKPPASVGK